MNRIICLCGLLLWVAANTLVGSAQTRDEESIFVRTNLVNVRVSVTDARGRSLSGLTKERFEVFDNSVRQRVAHFSDEAAPVSLGILYDVTGTTGEQTSRALSTLKHFVRAANAETDFFILAFDDRDSMSATFVPTAAQLSAQLDSTVTAAPVSLYDVLYRALGRVSAGHFQKKALLVISNGQTLPGRHTAKEIRDLLRESDVQVFAIGRSDPARESLADLGTLMFTRGEAGRERPPTPPDVEAAFGRAILDELARASGGYAYFPVLFSEPQFDDICARMAAELRQQYVVGFYPTDSSLARQWHKIEIRLAAPKRDGLVLSYRDGYRVRK